MSAETAVHEAIVSDWVTQHRADLLASARSQLRGTGLAEDAVQETFAAAFRHLQQHDRPPRQPGAWLQTILNHEVGRLARRQSREVPSELDTVVAPTALQYYPDPEDFFLAAADTERLKNLPTARAELTQRQESIIHERYDNQLAAREVAGRLGVKPPTVRVHERNALQRLADWYRRHENPVRAIAFIAITVGAVVAMRYGETHGLPVAMAAAGGFFGSKKKRGEKPAKDTGSESSPARRTEDSNDT